LRHLYIKRTFYQDRLRTNIGKALKNGPFFLRLFGRTVFEGIVADLPFANFFLVRKRLFRGFLFTTPSCLRFPRVFSKPVLTNHRVFDMETHIRLPLSAQAKLLHGHAFLDDLQSLDPGLYKNLIFVKHYDGDVEDLCLTFAGAKKPTLFDAIFSLKETIPFAKTGLGQSNARGSST
jgi:hypothetical protein